MAVKRKRVLIALLAVFPAAAFQSTPRLAPGVLLVASDKLKDPHFAESVVVLVRSDPDDGVLGLIVNRQLESPLFEIFPDIGRKRKDVLYEGGPVSSSSMQALVRSSTPVDSAENIFADVYAVVKESALEKLFTSKTPTERLRVFAGYAGWGPGQLEAEIRLGAWTVLRPRAGYVFDSDPNSLWRRLQETIQTQIARR